MNLCAHTQFLDAGTLPGIESLRRSYNDLPARFTPRLVTVALPRYAYRTALKWKRLVSIRRTIRKLAKFDTTQIPHVFYKTMMKKTSSGRWVYGTSDLKDTAAYTSDFANAVFAVWHNAYMIKLQNNAHTPMHEFNPSMSDYKHASRALGMKYVAEPPPKRRNVQTTLCLKPV